MTTTPPDITETVATIKQYVDDSFSGKGHSYTYIIGDNGIGKSRILKELADRYEEDESSSTSRILCVTNTLYDRFEINKNQKKIKYLGARNSSNAVFHTSIDRALAKYLLLGIAETSKFMSRLSKATEVEYSLKMPGALRPHLTDLNDHVDKRKLKNSSLMAHLGRVDHSLIKNFLYTTINLARLSKRNAQAILNFLELNPDVVVLIKKKKLAAAISFSELSSGEKNRILTSAKILSHARNNCLILIDEPETSLHLHWQRTFHETLTEILEGISGFHSIIATHSPSIVSECAQLENVEIIVLVDKTNEKQNMPKLEFEYSEATSIESYDGVVLDMFKTATKNTKFVHERVTNVLMDTFDKKLNRDEGQKHLQALLTIEGLTPETENIVERAIQAISDFELQPISDEKPS